MPLDFPALLGRVYYRYPSYLIDAVTEHESGNRLVAVKNVTVGEEFFQGHFPGIPIMPAVFQIEALTQFARVDAEARAIVQLRCFAGLSLDEAADVQGVSRCTAARLWAYARAWLGERLQRD